jgi:predicted CXXCH cytochrome family protein
MFRLTRIEPGYRACYINAGIVLLFLISALLTQAEASREVSEKRECSTCHIMWLKDFDRKDITPLVPYEPKPVVATGKQDVSSTNEMCFSCHDGFVLDSRSIWKSDKHNHPVGVKPSKKITIPTSKGKTVFPLNDDGKVYCGTCHTAHGVDWNQSESPVFLRVKNVESSMCLACHLEKSTGPKEGNHPIFKQPPNKPQQLIQAGSKFAKDGGVICQSCHSPHASDNKKILVMHDQDSSLCMTCHKDKKNIKATKHNLDKTAPEARNKKGQTTSESGVCASCHLPHGANGPMLWARTTVKTKDNAAARCISCHQENGLADDKTVGRHSHPTMVSVNKLGIQVKKGKWHSKNVLLSGKNHVDLPLYNSKGHNTLNGDKVSCGSCHDPHTWSKSGQPSQTEEGEFVEGDEYSSFLRIKQDEKSTLCLNCHLKKKSILSTKHNVFTKADLEQKNILNGGVCGQCHTPHNGKGTYLRARESKSQESNFSSLCKSCHSKESMAKEKLIEGFSHPVGVDLHKIKAHTSKLPLYDEDGNKVKQDGLVDCVTCHDAHTWAPDAEKLENQQKEGDASNSFLRISAAHNSKLCLECHKNKRTVLGTDHDLSISDSKVINKHGQDVAHSGVCGQCHSVHNATMETGLWAREPAKIASNVEKMCLSCHASGKVAEDKIPPRLQHPDHITAWSNQVREKRITDNPLPDIPVFDEKGERAHVGIITCLSCHDPHQWQPESKKSGDGKKYEGDAMNSFLRNANSELIICADCHGADAIFRYKYFHGETSRKKYPLYQ